MSSSPILPFGRTELVWVQKPISSDLTKQFIEAPNQPLAESLPVPIACDATKAKAQMQSTTHVTVSTAENVENKQKLSRVQNRGFDLVNFAKNHPFLTAGFILGIIFLAFTFPAITASFAKQTGITLFHAKLSVGLGLGLLTLYYGVYLINLARRAAIKDELEMKLAGLDQRRSDLLQAGSKNEIKQLGDALTQEANHVAETERDRIQELKTQKHTLLQQNQIQSKTHRLLESSVKKLENFIHHETFSTLPQEVQENAKNAFSKASQEIRQGISVLNASYPFSIDEPRLELPKEVEIPSLETEMQKKNQALKKSLTTKIGNFFSDLGASIKENPGSAFISTVGVLFTLIAIPALIYWFSGNHSVYLLGSLSLAGAFQFIIYGVSLIYEGYNSATIEKLKKELERIQSEEKKQELAEKSIRDQINKISEKARSSLAQYKDSWAKITGDMQNSLQSIRDQVQTKNENLQELVAECQASIQELFVAMIPSSLLPDPATQKEAIQAPFNGAQEIIKKLS